MIKTKFKGANPTHLEWGNGRPTSKDIVKHHKAANIKGLGYTNFTSDRPSKPTIKGKAKQV
jgi:hypothetical protein